MSFSIASLNVNGMVDDKKRNAIFYWYRKKKIDILCLQETHSSPETELKWGKEWVGKSFWNHGSSNSRGVAILLSETFQYDVIETGRDNCGRQISCAVKVSNKSLNILNIYAPNIGTDKKKYFSMNLFV